MLITCLLLANKWLNANIGALNTYRLWFALPFSFLIPVVLESMLQSTSMAVFTIPYVSSFQLSSLNQASSFSFGNLVFSTWLLGVIFVYAFALYWHMSSLRKLNATPISLPQDLNGPLNQIPVYESHQVASPMVTGFFTKKLIIPVNFNQIFSAEQRPLILHHELTHLRHRDIQWNWLALLILATFWFNPIFWLGYKAFRQQQELACDQQVLKGKALPQRQAYARALLQSCMTSPRQALTHLYYNEGIYMKERIRHLNIHKTTSNFKLIPSVAVLGFVALIGHSAFAHPVKKDFAKPLHREAPLYPIEAAQQAIEGFVQLSFDIETDGSVSNASIIKSQPAGVFDKSALKAIKKWRYQKPSRKKSNIEVQLDFVLGNGESNDAPKFQGTEIISVKY